MAVERSQHQKWYDAQRDALLELGFDLADITARLDWILANLPQDADPATHIFEGWQLNEDIATPESVRDAKIAWLADDDVGPRFKLILDAKAEAN